MLFDAEVNDLTNLKFKEFILNESRTMQVKLFMQDELESPEQVL